MKKFLMNFTILAVGTLCLCGCTIADNRTTFCNPINIDYRFETTKPHRRVAADPVIVMFEDDYYLFGTGLGGYYWSHDLVKWNLVTTNDMPIWQVAPAAFVYDGQLYYTAFSTKAFFKATDPKGGKWTRAADSIGYADPAVFIDDDSKAYMYFGCSTQGSDPAGDIKVVQLDGDNGFKTVSNTIGCANADYQNRGWERRGDDNTGNNGSIDLLPWVEGPWMTKHNGRYYLQYAAPGTEFMSYADGIYVGDSPLGPFEYAEYSPFSHKPTGFITGAGHGATFMDRHGNYWRVVTMVVSVKHMFERRLGIFPVGFDADGQMRTNTYLGDWPQFASDAKAGAYKDNFAGWMLLSHGKDANASSVLDAMPVSNAFDENIKTHFSATTGEKGQWLSVDLGSICTINALQINFAEQDMTALGRIEGLYQQYLVDASRDGKTWNTIIEKSNNKIDAPHDYVPLENPASARYVRITNVYTPAGGKFALRDLRIFGKGKGSKPKKVSQLTVERNADDRTKANVSWPAAKNATGYVVRFGAAKNKLYGNYQVFEKTSIDINSLTADVDYYFTVDAFNENGIKKGTKVKQKK